MDYFLIDTSRPLDAALREYLAIRTEGRSCRWVFSLPGFWPESLAVGLPIWLHLLKRHKTDPEAVPVADVLRIARDSSVKHRRLDHILLFVLRTLMMLLLALLFASPFIRRSAAASRGKKLTVIAVDHSFSMRARREPPADAPRTGASKLRWQSQDPGDQAQVIALGRTGAGADPADD